MSDYSIDHIKTRVYDAVTKTYDELLSSNYVSVYSVDPTPFRMRDSSNIKGVVVNTIEYFPSLSRDLFFIYLPNEGNSIEELVYPQNLIDTHYNFKYGSQFVTSAITQQFGISEEDILYNIPLLPFYVDNEEYLIPRIESDIDLLIRSELQAFHQHVNHQASYYAKNAAKYSYSLLDLGEVIEKVADEDFEYQLNEAIAAYDNSLYLASTATLGVSLETLCIKILKNNNVKLKDSDSTVIKVLANTLKQNALINRKEHQRICVAYDIRNLASHSSRGQMIQADCNYLISVIHDLALSHF
ncbi:hypothetical protein [Exiguobacterium acetylicum]|uniref:hypothetical protein n=1 Tax=Exiguobacterium acetylicum TaxID=41170 RepID=UPI001EE19184|nr:hypothetical protein [Exiguobacterium acetylicum]UKS54908.1 hypothetical protein K6T22_10125 [Exiguobacterium acetylicum]